MDFDEGKMRQQTVPPNVRVMKRMLAHLDEHYGGITGYLHNIGISADEASPFPCYGLTVHTRQRPSCARLSPFRVRVMLGLESGSQMNTGSGLG